MDVLQLGHPLLRQVASSVTPDALAQSGQDRALQMLIDDLIATAIATNGIGIAAPQVAASDRLFIVASRPNERYPDAPEMEPTAMINPVLLDRSDQEELGWEGCLSVPDQRGQVWRAQEIRVEYCDRWGNTHRRELSGFVARIFQHELDHLDGILFVDRVDPADLVTEIEYLERLGNLNRDSSS